MRFRKAIRSRLPQISPTERRQVEFQGANQREERATLSSPSAEHDDAHSKEGITEAKPPPACGRLISSARIVGGFEAEVGSWPWQASIQILGSHQCGGTLIASSWVLTAAHCFSSCSDPSLFVILLGAYNLSYPGPESILVNVKQIIVHSNYSGFTKGNDIALMELKSPVNFTQHIQPACFPGPSIVFPPRLGCWVAGWGNIESEVPLPEPGLLQEVLLPLVDRATCEALYSDLKVPWIENVIKDDMICAGYMEGKKDACQGDSGGPLLCPWDGAWVLAGLVSWGDICAAPERPGVYTRVSAHSSWILGHAPEVESSFINAAPSNGCFWLLMLILLRFLH
ncbi:serine protease 27-like [Python bivittatus]|uniref:Serine protease 27-like n=1 Tax=Python bivittatus TaxID=176946 RepID=A0A9F5IW58_PYTBI|nr:serine protease 27-like [Python bivittatus]